MINGSYVGKDIPTYHVHDLRYARLAQSVEHQTFNLRVAGSSPSLGVNLYALKERATCDN